MDEPLDKLLVQLCAGDVSAAGQVFTAFEPYLRRAVRRQIPAPLRAKFDSADVMQSVWADVIRTFREAGCRFVDVDHLRGFLFIAARNRLIDRIRQHQRRAECEEPIGDRHPPSKHPRPSEVAAANELWEQILANCPTEHHSILLLRRQGYRLTEIAEQTGLHCDSVRRILRTLARHLAFGESSTKALRSACP
jgi:RNA polymerase sigma factor (sigma-70 family)